MTRSTDSGALPRRVVLDLLLGRRGLPTRQFAAAADAAGLEGRDRALARELLSGVIRRQSTLDALFAPYSSRRKLEPAVLATLRIALYQRFFLAHVPAYAAFNATLDAARPRLRKAVGFVNAVLRAVDRGCTEESPAQREAAGFRLAAGTRSWSFDKPVFPDPVQEPLAYAAVVESHPGLLVGRWSEAVGEDAAQARLRAGNAVLPATVRVNTLRSSVGKVRTGFEAEGIPCEAGPCEGTLVLPERTGDVRRLPGFAQGAWSIQDPSALQAVALAAPAAGERILDLCAAPGGKAFAMFELAGGRADVLACDVAAARLERLEEDRKRLGHRVRTRVLAKGAPPPAGEWDLIVLDVPCTNTGVLARRPEARWRFDAGSLQRALDAQAGIQDSVLESCIGSATRVLWSTCSLEPEENRGMAERAATRSGLVIVDELLCEPTAQHGGGYAALLQRRNG